MLLHIDVIDVIHVFPVWFEDVPIISYWFDEIAQDGGIGVDGVVLRRCERERDIHSNQNPLVHLDYKATLEQLQTIS